MQARTLLAVTVSDPLRLLQGAPNKVIVTIDFFRLTFWCVVGALCWLSQTSERQQISDLGWGAFSRRGWLSDLGACEWQ